MPSGGARASVSATRPCRPSGFQRSARITCGRLTSSSTNRRRAHPEALAHRRRVHPRGAGGRLRAAHRRRPAVVRLERILVETGRLPLHPLRQRPGADCERARDCWRFSGAGSAYIEPGSPWQNPYVECFGSRIRDELLAVEQFSCLAEVQVMVEDWREDYNRRRPHSALQMMAPARFARGWRLATQQGKVIPFTDPVKALRSTANGSVSMPPGENVSDSAPGPRQRARRLAALALRARCARQRLPYPSHTQRPPTLTAGGPMNGVRSHPLKRMTLPT